MDVKKYLKRIGVGDVASAELDFELLKKLQLAHIYSVPYENLDAVRGIPIALDEESLFEKIVLRRRGGWCFELNSLFEKLLAAIGFSVESRFARFWRGEVGIPQPRHRVTVVNIGRDKYLVDVGVGTAVPRIPLAIKEGVVYEYLGEGYRFERDEDFGWVLCELYRGEWRRCYSFTDEKQYDVDFVATSYFCEHHSSSKFNKENIVSLKTESGRKTVDGSSYKVFVGSELTYIEENMTDARLNEVLIKEFGINT